LYQKFFLALRLELGMTIWSMVRCTTGTKVTKTQTSDLRSQISDLRPQTTDLRPQIWRIITIHGIFVSIICRSYLYVEFKNLTPDLRSEVWGLRSKIWDLRRENLVTLGLNYNWIRTSYESSDNMFIGLQPKIIKF